MPASSLITPELEMLIENHMPEDFSESDFYIGLILEAKGDLPPVNIKHKKPRDSKIIDEAIRRKLRRTNDFVPRTRHVPYSLGRETYHTRRPDRTYRKRIHPRKSGARSHLRNFRPEIPQIALNHGHSDLMTLESILEITQGMDTKPFLSESNLYVSIATGQYKGTYRIGFVQNIKDADKYDSKSRNYSQSELSHLLAQNNFEARFFYEDSNLHLGLSVDDTEKTFRFVLIENPTYVDPKTLRPLVNASFQTNFEYANGLFDVQRYERPHSNEESQTRPKIPFREISAIRYRSQKLRRAKYMVIDMPKDRADESHTPREPVPVQHRQATSYTEGAKPVTVTTWHYTPLVRMH